MAPGPAAAAAAAAAPKRNAREKVKIASLVLIVREVKRNTTLYSSRLTQTLTPNSCAVIKLTI